MTYVDRVVAVPDASAVASARRAATQVAETLGLKEVPAGKAALVATELATNLVKHAGGGSLLVGSNAEHALVLVAIDHGRGMANVAAAMHDGYSTAGSAGTGLGAIQRAANFTDLYTLPDRGTAILCRIENETPRPPLVGTPARIDIGGVCIPKPGEEYAGDAWVAVQAGDATMVAVADGLGHGQGASIASQSAIRVFARDNGEALERLMQDAHGALRPTRGAAVGLARIHGAHGRIDFAGVGNIAGTIAADDGVRRVVSLGGIVGHEMRKVQTFSYPWTASSVLVLQSDGVSASWNAANYPGLMQHDLVLIAAVLYRDFVRGNDDATVVVAKAS
ncbi:MAG: ATP-binding protein [Thermoanaerobaculia bacterium]